MVNAICIIPLLATLAAITPASDLPSNPDAVQELIRSATLPYKWLEVDYTIDRTVLPEGLKEGYTEDTPMQKIKLKADVLSKKFLKEILGFKKIEKELVPYSLQVSAWDGEKATNWTQLIEPSEYDVFATGQPWISGGPVSASIKSTADAASLAILQPWISMTTGKPYLNEKNIKNADIRIEKRRIGGREGDIIIVSSSTLEVEAFADNGDIASIGLRAYEKNGKPYTYKKISIFGYWDLENGLSFPKRMVVELFNSEGMPTLKSIYSIDIKNLSYSVSSQDAELFAPELPVGSSVIDYINKKQYTVLGIGGNGSSSSREERIESLLKQHLQKANQKSN